MSEHHTAYAQGPDLAAADPVSMPSTVPVPDPPLSLLNTNLLQPDLTRASILIF